MKWFNKMTDLKQVKRKSDHMKKRVSFWDDEDVLLCIWAERDKLISQWWGRLFINCCEASLNRLSSSSTSYYQIGNVCLFKRNFLFVWITKCIQYTGFYLLKFIKYICSNYKTYLGCTMKWGGMCPQCSCL